MKKYFFPFLFSIVTILFFVSVFTNIYFVITKLNESQSIKYSDSFKEYTNNNCLQKAKNDIAYHINYFDISVDYTVVEKIPFEKYKENKVLLEDSIIEIYDNHKCEILNIIKYNSYGLKGANALLSLNLTEKTLTIKYHINPNNSILRMVYISTDAKKEDDYFTEICNPSKPSDCKVEKENLPNELTQIQAIEKVKEVKSVKEFISSIPKWGYEIFSENVDSSDESYYSIKIYQSTDERNITQNWYSVNKYTGEVTIIF